MFSKEDIGLEICTQEYLGTKYGLFEVDSPYNVDEVCAVVNMDTDEIIGYTIDDLYDYLCCIYDDINW